MITVTEYSLTGICHMLTFGKMGMHPPIYYLWFTNRKIPSMFSFVLFCMVRMHTNVGFYASQYTRYKRSEKNSPFEPPDGKQK